MNSITRRWVRGSLLLTLIALCLAEAVFLYFTITNYYDGTARALYTRANTLSTQLSVMGTQTEESRSAAVRRMVEQFEEKDRFELMRCRPRAFPRRTSRAGAMWPRRTPVKRARGVLCTTRQWVKR